MKKLIFLILIFIVLSGVACNNSLKNKKNPNSMPVEIDELQKEKDESEKNELKQNREVMPKNEAEEEKLKNSLENNLNKEKKKDNAVELHKPETLDKTENIPNKEN